MSAAFRKMVGGKWIRPRKRLAIYLRDNFKCAYCLKDLTGSPSEISLDHLRPYADGLGLGWVNREDNLVTACRVCNSKKGKGSWVKFASNPESIQRIRRNRRRSLKKYYQMADELRSDD